MLFCFFFWLRHKVDACICLCKSGFIFNRNIVWLKLSIRPNNNSYHYLNITKLHLILFSSSTFKYALFTFKRSRPGRPPKRHFTSESDTRGEVDAATKKTCLQSSPSNNQKAQQVAVSNKHAALPSGLKNKVIENGQASSNKEFRTISNSSCLSTSSSVSSAPSTSPSSSLLANNAEMFQQQNLK